MTLTAKDRDIILAMFRKALEGPRPARAGSKRTSERP
jgi:hypothetical protein